MSNEHVDAHFQAVLHAMAPVGGHPSPVKAPAWDGWFHMEHEGVEIEIPYRIRNKADRYDHPEVEVAPVAEWSVLGLDTRVLEAFAAEIADAVDDARRDAYADGAREADEDRRALAREHNREVKR